MGSEDMAANTRNTRGGATAAHTESVGGDHSTKESLVGTDRRGMSSNVSWGAIVAGVVTFLAITVLLSLVTAGIGLSGSGAGAGIWSVISLALALAAAGYVAGALAVRGGLLHGFLTWATAVLTGLVLATWLSANLLGAVGGVVGSVVGTAAQATDVSPSQVTDAVQQNVDPQDVDAAQERAGEVVDDVQAQADEIADTASSAAWWGFFGMLIGAVIAAVAGMLGARSVVTREEKLVATR